MKKRLFLMTLTTFFGFANPLMAQDQDLLPGVTIDLIGLIQTQLSTTVSDKYQVSFVLNVDSALGEGLGPLWPEIGPVENPYGTLTHCFIFNARRNTEHDPSDSASGIVGVFGNGRILWHSDGILTVKGAGMDPDWIWAIKDINRGGKVGILTNWISQSSGINPPMFLWIFSWDGQQGTVINARDEDNQSVLVADENSVFELADIDGDGIWEIQGNTSSYVADSTQTEFQTYSWNGSLYGLWPGTPQPNEGTDYPQDKLQVTVSSQVTAENGHFQYRYRVGSMLSSLQDMRVFAIDCFTDSVTFGQVRKFWDAAISWPQVISWWSYGIDGFNFIDPGKGDSNFVFTTTSITLPKILKFYAQGWNGESDNSITASSFQGFTVGPVNIPNPYVPIDFLDTLTSYTTQSRSLGWIKDPATADKYTGYFSSAKTSLQQNYIGAARSTLQQVLQDVNIDSTSNMTSEAYALIRYNIEYLLAQLPVPPSGFIVKLVSSTGTRLTTGSLQYYEGSWKDATNNNDGTFSINTTTKTLSLRMTYQYGTQTKSNVTVGTDTAVFQTVNAQIKLQDSKGNPLDTGTVQYYAGGWRNLGTTTNGVATKELLPNSYSFRMTYAYGSNDKQQNIGTNPTVVFQTVNATVQLKNSQGNLIDTGMVQYYGGAWRSFGTTAGGAATKELLPNSYSFRMTYEFVPNDKAQDISANSTVSFSTVLCTVSVTDSQNQPVNNIQASYYSGAWRQIGTTVNGQVTKELLPANLTFRITYGTSHQDKTQNLSTNNVVQFSIQP